jgi:hypothetical protein
MPVKKYVLMPLFLGALALIANAAETVQIVPSEITLTSPSSRHVLILERVRDKIYVGQVTNDVAFTSSDTNVVRIADGMALPVHDGKATITARSSAGIAKAEVIVRRMRDPFEWNFRNEVQPVLVKAGCSTGPCHGAAAGQNGFKLSLRGYDDEGDYTALTHQAFGRRINFFDPGRSMILTKPTTAVPHKGGKRFEVESQEYKILSVWIASGAPGPRTNDARIQSIEILPAHVVLKPGDAQQLIVHARFSDGRVQDVTHWAKFTAANGTVTQVDDEGRVKVVGMGEGPITAWYLSKIAIGTVTVPFTNKVSAATFTKAPHRNFIDELALEKLRELNIPPSPRCSDSEFIRRAFLDTVGILPTVEETQRFLADRNPKKRDALVESLLSRSEFVDYWSHKWSDLLLVSSKVVSAGQRLKAPAMWSYYNWIRRNVEANTPWDQFVREIILAQGSTLDNGAGNFYVLHDNPREAAENVSLAFLGMSMQCAKCHNHPMEKWTNDQYYQFANLFARVRAKAGPGGEGDNIIFVSDEGDLVQPRTGKPQPPAPLDGKSLSIESREDRRRAVTDWLTSPDNTQFTRAIVNRIWANFYGVGLVEAVDDLRATNPASNDKLFNAAAKFLVENHYDLKALMRAILQSETYQRSSVPLEGNKSDTRFYSRYYPRRLSAEVLLDCVSAVTEAPTIFKGEKSYGGPAPISFPVGMRALQLPDSNLDSYFLKVFGKPEREKTCECERTADPNVTQMLHICNGDTINKKLEAKQNRITRQLDEKLPDQKIVDETYLRALCRLPTDSERKEVLKTLAAADQTNRREVVEDTYWALLSSKEFLFNH